MLSTFPSKLIRTTNIPRIWGCSFAKMAKKSPPGSGIVKNDAIPYPEIRLVSTDENGKSVSEILKKSDALKLASVKKLDLILVNGNENPPICKLDSYVSVLRNIKEKESEQRKKAKANVMKEISIGATIDTHDLNIKMKKVNEFLDRDFQVRLIIFASKFVMEKKPLAIDETTLKVLDYLERFSTGPVMPSSKSADRVDFILSPKQRLFKDTPAVSPPPPPAP